MITFCLLGLLVAGTTVAKITLPPAEEIKLDNGLTVTVIERHNLPLFSFRMTFRAGSIYDPEGDEGLASLANEMLMRGTETRTAKQIAEEIAFGGGTLANFGGRESAGFSGEFLTAQGEKGFEILADLLLNSTLADDELEKTRARTIANLQSRLEDPRAVASEKIFTTILGDSRYAHAPDGMIGSVEGLKRADIVEFLKAKYTPNNAILVVCGDIDGETVRAWIGRYFESWTGTSESEAIAAKFPPVTGRKVLLFDKEDATQTQIRIGGGGLKIGDPDYHALEVARTVYASGFTSRLMNEIRVNRGLSYGVSCRSNRYQPGGVLYVSTFTKNQSVGEVIDIILAESQRIQTEPVPDTEFVGAINYRKGLYPLRFETNDDLADVFSDLWLDGVDKSFYEDYQEELKEITKEQAMAVSEKYFPLENYRLVLVGKADEIRSQVEKYGDLTVIPFAGE
jgi:zinc protease